MEELLDLSTQFSLQYDCPCDQEERPSNATVCKDLARTRICSHCWRLCFSTEAYQAFFERTGPESRLQYTIPLVDLLNSAQTGCPWCEALLRICNRNPCTLPKLLSAETPVEVEITMEHGQFSDELLPDHSFEEFGLFWLRAQFDAPIITGFPNMPSDYLVAFVESTALAAPRLPIRPIRTDYTSQETFSELRDWLEHCSQHHEACRSQHSSKLPSRLIQIEETGQIKLVVTDIRCEYKYVALSYCWGHGQEGLTSKENIARRLQGLDISALPQAIRDAIHVTSQLNLCYLWVDAVCIVQNDEDDKNSEVAAMCDIYRNAFLTISATNSPSASETFLEPKNPKFENIQRLVAIPDPIEVPYWVPGGPLDTCLIQSRRWIAPNREPINLRAWTLQEWLLSRRVISFTSLTIQMQCQEQLLTLGTIFHDIREDDRRRIAPPVLRRPQTLGKSDIPSGMLIEAWSEACARYSQRTLSFKAERLVALAGLAEVFSHHFNAPYLAGHWAGTTLPYLLCWKTDPGFRRQPSMELGFEYLAPTWSWIASARPVVWTGLINPAHDYYPLVDIMSSTTTLKHQKLPFGRVLDGQITLRGKVLTGVWDPDEDVIDLYGTQIAGHDLDFDFAEPEDKLEISILPLFETVSNVQKHAPGKARGLLLTMELPPAMSARYYRIGHFSDVKSEIFAVNLDVVDPDQVLILI